MPGTTPTRFLPAPSPTSWWSLPVLVLVLALQLPLLTPGCAGPAPRPTDPGETAEAVRLELPEVLEAERALYREDLEAALGRVVGWFGDHGLAVDRRQLLRSTIVFADRGEARRRLSKHFGVAAAKIPDGFSGTVDGDRLFLVSREIYAQNFARLYPDLRWSADEYRALIVHELAHRAHALRARALFGSEDGMGPRWFFEGLAIACAGQFSAPAPPLSWQQLEDRMGRDAKAVLSYPLYGQMFRSLTASFPVRWLVEQAGRKGFAALLEAEYLPSELVLEAPSRRRSRGTVLLVHGSAPFDLDGRIPVPGLASAYARTSFYKDLAARLRTAGWSVLRYSKPGVAKHGIDAARYARTDLALLSRQLRNLWRFLPPGQPRIVFAWSEGTLHLRALPAAELDAVILLGAISTSIGEVIRAQGGPPAESLRGELAGRDRLEMLGLDRPVGRLLDELGLEPNWRTFQPLARRPLLVLHGTEDREVPFAQAAVWKEALPRHRLEVRAGQGLDHRFMSPGKYDLTALVRAITSWLDQVYPLARQ